MALWLTSTWANSSRIEQTHVPARGAKLAIPVIRLTAALNHIQAGNARRSGHEERS